MGHAVGLWHEHTRATRDQVLLINWDNIEEGKEHNFQTYTQRNQDGFDHLTFDFNSIMLYHSFAFAGDSGIPTITLRNGGWTAWRHVAGGIAAPGARVAAVSRAAGKVDLFVVGLDLGIHTAAWESGRDSRNVYRGWWRIGTDAAPGTQLSATARDANKLDVFAIGTSGRIYTAAWDANVAGGTWRGWWLLP